MNPTAPDAHPLILLAEDEELVRRVLVRRLSRHGYPVLAASTGHEALQLISHAETPPRLMISDVIMPDMSGQDLAAKAMALCPGLKVLYMSGYSTDFLQGRGVLRSDDHFIEKTTIHAELLTKITEILKYP